MKKICILLSLVIMTVSVPVAHAAPAEDRLPAFPGAEGGGMYTTGARAANNPEIYHVTTLEDYGKDEPVIKGSFRDAVSEDNRIIVFDVAGNIELKSRLNIGGNNLTILGQTAPGDGICLTGYDTHIESQTSNIILRYLRFRMGDSNDVEDDSLGGRYCSNVIVDHCSVSWSVDECASFYDNTDFTMQWCIISESLNNSVHGKGAHGYGGIWGGRNASFHHNLMAHHSSRNPRAPQGDLEGSADYDMSTQTTLSDWRNNVIYNWGGNSAYGGQGAMALNIINCYYKAGPATDDGKRSKIYELSSTGNGQTFKWSTDLYVDGTYVDGDPNVTENNALGITKDSSAQNYYVWTNGHSGTSSKDINYSDINENTDAQKVHFKYQTDYPVTTQTAEEAYEDVLAKAGASVSRDSLDARVVEDVRLGRGECGKNKNGIIDTPSEAGGLPTLSGIPEPDSDKDGLPDRWEEQNGTNKNNPGDAVQIVSSGYTNIEEYANDVADGSYVRGNATPTATPTPAPTPTATPTVTPTGAPTAAPTATPGPAATITPVPTAAPTSTVAPVPTAEPTPVTTEAPKPTPTVTPAETVAPTPVTTEAPKPAPTAESTAEPTPTSVTTKTPEPTEAAEPTATAEPQSSVTPYPEPTNEICWQPQGAGEFDPPPVIINNLLIVDLLPSRPFGDSSQSPWQFDDFGIRATENPKSATNKPDNGYAPISGSAAKINVMTDGVIETKQKASFGKTGYVFEFDKGTDTGGRAIYKHPGQGLIETVIFDAKEYCDYYIFVAGSKGIIGEIIFTPNESGNRTTPEPTGPPTPTATPEPTTEPTPATTEAPKPTPTVTPAATTAPTPVTTEPPPSTPTVTPTETAAPTPVTTKAPPPTPTVTPVITAIPTEIPTPTPTTTKKPDLTPPGPTAKPVPTAEPTSTPTATSAPTAEPTPVTTEAPQPTTAPTATVTPEATSIPAPTSEPVNTPSSEPKPTATSLPTAVPSPTATSTPEPTVKPENGYMYQIDNLTVSDNTVIVELTNISGSDAKLIIASYTEAGILTDIQEEDIAIAVGDTDSIVFEYGILNADIIKAFVWNSFEGNRPMAEAKEITYNQKNHLT